MIEPCERLRKQMRYAIYVPNTIANKHIRQQLTLDICRY